MSDTLTTPQPIKYNPKFIEEVDIYIESAKKRNKVPTLRTFAKRIGVDEQTVVAWSNKHTKDEDGNLTEEFARPVFREAIKRLKPSTPQPEVTVAEEVKKEQPIAQPKEEKLTPKQELFCQLYSSDREFFGNGVQTYIEVYEPNQSKPNWYRSACASASEILSNPKVCNRINELLEDSGLNDSFVDKQLLFIINQHADLGSKIAAIREYNKLKQRIIDKIDHTTKGKEMPTPIYGGRSTK